MGQGGLARTVGPRHDDVDEETVENKIEELKKQKKRLTDRIYLLKRKHIYTADVDDLENLFPDS